jgi:hypothetical protein
MLFPAQLLLAAVGFPHGSEGRKSPPKLFSFYCIFFFSATDITESRRSNHSHNETMTPSNNNDDTTAIDVTGDDLDDSANGTTAIDSHGPVEVASAPSNDGVAAAVAAAAEEARAVAAAAAEAKLTAKRELKESQMELDKFFGKPKGFALLGIGPARNAICYKQC